jgi:glycosyltransferase involved in cell wall biosynthesis
MKDVPSVPVVSIGLPVYNGARFLAASLDSLLAQTFVDFELVITDNASTDETEEICREYAAGDPRIRYIRHETNRGAAWNFNNLVGATAGRYFKWATHDDVHAPTYVERCLEAFQEGGDRIALAYPRTRIIDEHGEFVRDYVDAVDARQSTPHERLRALVTNLDMGNPMFGLMLRSTLERTRLNGSFPSSDYVLLAELALLGEIWEIPEFLFLRRDHPGTSRRAHAPGAEIAEWFEPGSARRRKREFTRLLVEHVRSIHSLPLALPERLRCDLAFADVWLRRNGVHVVGELLGMEYQGGWIPFRRPRTVRSRT